MAKVNVDEDFLNKQFKITAFNKKTKNKTVQS